MKTKIKKKFIEEETRVYVAEDGTEFETEKACRDYEDKILHPVNIKQAEKLRIKYLDGVIPLSNSGLTDENNTFRWYKVENKEDASILNDAYRIKFKPSLVYPEIICIETAGYEPYKDDAYAYHVTNLKEITENFWKKLGYRVVIEKEQAGVTGF